MIIQQIFLNVFFDYLSQLSCCVTGLRHDLNVTDCIKTSLKILNMFDTYILKSKKKCKSNSYRIFFFFFFSVQNIAHTTAFG